MELPWGMFKGKMMHEIPSSYIHWLAESCNDEKICSAADREWQWREKHDKHWED